MGPRVTTLELPRPHELQWPQLCHSAPSLDTDLALARRKQGAAGGSSSWWVAPVPVLGQVATLWVCGLVGPC